jgi:hypothetical protein
MVQDAALGLHRNSNISIIFTIYNDKIRMLYLSICIWSIHPSKKILLENCMTEMDFSGFTVAYINYFGHEPIIRKKGAKNIKISTCKYVIPNSSIPQIAEFYKFRLERGLTCKQKMEDIDYAYLEEGLISKTMLKIAVAVCLQVSYDVFGAELRNNKNLTLKEIEYRIKYKSINNKTEFTLTWNGETKTMHEWAKDIGITVVALRRRYKEYGLCDLLFMSREDFKLNNGYYYRLQKYNPETVGTEEWRKLSASEPAARLEKLDIPLKNATSLITAMIKDAIDNVETRNKKYFYDSVSFLTNGNGYIQWLLDAFPKCSTKYILKELQSKYSKYQRKQLQNIMDSPDQEMYA